MTIHQAPLTEHTGHFSLSPILVVGDVADTKLLLVQYSVR